MNWRVALLMVFVIGCRKTEPSAEASDAAAIAPAATVSASAAAAAGDSSAPPTPASPSKYTFAKQTDGLGRWSIEIPTTFAKTENKECSDNGCSLRATFKGDGILVELTPGEGKSNPVLAAGLRAGKITGQKTLPRGFWVAMTAKDEHVFVQEISGFAEPVVLTVSGPLARKSELEALIGRLSASLVVPTARPSSYCRPLPWGDGGTEPSADFDGKLSVGIGLNGKMENERPYVIALDPPVCDAMGRACWEAQVYSMEKDAALRSLVGRRVHVTGTFHAMETAHHHRPVMIHANAIGVQ